MKKLLAVLPVLALFGCGTMSAGTSQKISFSSNIGGAGIYNQDNKLVCIMPCSAQISRQSGEMILVAKKKGYIDKPFRLTVKMEGSFLKHFLTSGVTSVISSPATTTDLTSGAAFEFEPDHVYVPMIKAGSPAEMARQRDEADIRRFVLSNYADLAAEAAAGRGEKLETLEKMTFTMDNEVVYAIEQNPQKEKAAEALVFIYRCNKNFADEE